MTSPRSDQPVLDLILCRLLAAKDRSDTLAKIRKDLVPMIPGSEAAVGVLVAAAVDAASSRGLVEAKKARGGQRLTLTEAGKDHALSFLGIGPHHEPGNWTKIKATTLAARVLSLPAPDSDHAKRFASVGGYRAAVLRQRLGLPLGEFPTLAQAADALAWALVGLKEEGARKFTRDAVVAAAMRTAPVAVRLVEPSGPDGRPVDPQKAVALVVAQMLNARGVEANDLRLAAVQAWIEQAEPTRTGPPPPLPPIDLPKFAERVLIAARGTNERFGDNKVFIAHVWEAARNDPALAGIDFGQFKKRLGEANQAGLLSLRRADLTGAMDRPTVDTSAMHYLGADYHFVVV